MTIIICITLLIIWAFVLRLISLNSLIINFYRYFYVRRFLIISEYDFEELVSKYKFWFIFKKELSEKTRIESNVANAYEKLFKKRFNWKILFTNKYNKYLTRDEDIFANLTVIGGNTDTYKNIDFSKYSNITGVNIRIDSTSYSILIKLSQEISIISDKYKLISYSYGHRDSINCYSIDSSIRTLDGYFINAMRDLTFARVLDIKIEVFCDIPKCYPDE